MRAPRQISVNVRWHGRETQTTSAESGVLFLQHNGVRSLETSEHDARGDRPCRGYAASLHASFAERTISAPKQPEVDASSMERVPAHTKSAETLSWANIDEAYGALGVLCEGALRSRSSNNQRQRVNLCWRQSSVGAVERPIAWKHAHLSPATDHVCILDATEVHLGSPKAVLEEPSHNSKSRVDKDPNVAEHQPQHCESQVRVRGNARWSSPHDPHEPVRSHNCPNRKEG
mmetsp:Transcript_31349/g.83391  ORF Transcript_31349/g.83391 Transcript_31349/m.83391 type:complete len:231 (-) Transcript_31349:389-1081(-)